MVMSICVLMGMCVVRDLSVWVYMHMSEGSKRVGVTPTTCSLEHCLRVLLWAASLQVRERG